MNWFKQNYYGNLVSPVDVDITTYTDLGIPLQFYLPNHGSGLLTNVSVLSALAWISRQRDGFESPHRFAEVY